MAKIEVTGSLRSLVSFRDCEGKEIMFQFVM